LTPTVPQRRFGRCGRGWALGVTGVAAVALAVPGGLVLRRAAVGAAQDPTSCRSDKIALVNGGFEEPLSPRNGWTLHSEAAVAGWETTAPDGRIEIWNGTFGGVSHPEGVQHSELNATAA
jgi:hypothetical protein